MSRKRYTPEQIIGKLREAELALSRPIDASLSAQKASIFCQYVHLVGRPRRFPGLFSAPVVPTPVGVMVSRLSRPERSRTLSVNGPE